MSAAVLRRDEIPSPIGPWLAVCNAEGLTGLFTAEHRGGPPPRWATDASQSPGVPLLRQARIQLAAYFAGELHEFDLPLDPTGTTFQRAVWQELRRIAFGQTVRYGELARRIGVPGGARAVGAANGQNPISIVVPCHRVVGSGDHLRGYAGGIHRKRWLLEHENANRARPG